MRAATRFSANLTLSVILALSLPGAVPGLAQDALDVTIYVNTWADSYGEGTDGDCSLREALQAAMDDVAFGGCPAGSTGTDIIDLSAATHRITRAGRGENGNGTGDFDLGPTTSIIIQGEGARYTVIDGGQVDRIFDVAGGASLTLRDLTIRNGEEGTTGCACGGGIYVRGPDGSVTIEDSVVTGNAAGDGGGIYVASGSLTATQSTISGNRALGNSKDGGGIYLADATPATLKNVTLSGNQANRHGGALFSDGGVVGLSNVTIANNTADSDGNGSGDGGGISMMSGKLYLKNTLIARNDDRGNQAHDCSGTISSQDYNLIEETAGCTIAGVRTHLITGVDPNLAPLYDYGSGVLAHLLMPRSPALGSGNPATPGSITEGACELLDARGVSRSLSKDGCDLGAYEYVANYTVNSTADEPDAAPGSGGCATAGGKCTLRAAIQEANTRMHTTIYVPSGSYALGIPGRGENGGATGDLDVGGAITIVGAGAHLTTVNAARVDRVFDVVGGPAALIGLSLTGGEEGTTGCGCGAGVYVRMGPALLYRTAVADNRATDGGGVFVADGETATVAGCIIAGNTALGGTDGGGLAADMDSTLTVINSTISGNRAGGSGGGLFVYDEGTAYVYSTTVANNVADSDNSGAGDGGGIGHDGALVFIRNALLGGNVDRGGQAHDCTGILQSRSHNLVSSFRGCTLVGDTVGNLNNVDPKLDSLGDNGGSTLTHALFAGSPAIDAGSPGRCTDVDGNPLLKDQRGEPRGRDQVCDIGAFEGLIAKIDLPLILR